MTALRQKENLRKAVVAEKTAKEAKEQKRRMRKELLNKADTSWQDWGSKMQPGHKPGPIPGWQIVISQTKWKKIHSRMLENRLIFQDTSVTLLAQKGDQLNMDK